jgi:hypothetical protein
VTLAVDDPDVRLYRGDALETLRDLSDESVHCIVTSPRTGTGRTDAMNQPYHYVGEFPLALLSGHEKVCSAGDGSGACVVSTDRGDLRVDIGDWIIRSDDGRLATLRPVLADGKD